MNTIIGPLLDRCVCAYLDEILMQVLLGCVRGLHWNFNSVRSIRFQP